MPLDITNIKSVGDAAAKVDTIDMLINTAGVNTRARVLEDNILDFEVNILGNLKVYQAFANKVNEGGAIVTITSILALINKPKAKSETIVTEMFAGIESKTFEIYPDDFAKSILEGLLTDPKAVEANFPDSIRR